MTSILELLPRQSALPENETKTAIAGNDKTPDFKQFLSQSMKRAELFGKHDSSQANNSNKTREINFKTFRETIKSNVAASRTGRNSEVKTDSAVKGQELKEDVFRDTEDKAAAEVVSQVLGLQLSELVKLLENFNIKPGELSDASKINEIAAILGKGLGLNQDQSHMLQKVLVEVVGSFNEKVEGNKVAVMAEIESPIPENIDSGENKTEAITAEDSQSKANSAVQIPTVTANTVAKSDVTPELTSESQAKGLVNSAENTALSSQAIQGHNSEIIAVANELNTVEGSISVVEEEFEAIFRNEISADVHVAKVMKDGMDSIVAKLENRLDNLSAMEEKHPEGFMKQLAVKVESIINQTIAVEIFKEPVLPAQIALEQQAENLAKVNQSLELEQGETKGAIGLEAAELSKDQLSTMPNSSSEKHSQGEEALKDNGSANKEMTQSIDNNYAQYRVDAAPVQNPKVEDLSVRPKELEVSKQEIINQVIDKAKVILGHEKSEMILDLKPESLGKLALKVITERGMVVAKFVAESQQVKEVLESNMQLLKDSLEKQGLSVQGFSVSVRQDSKDNQQNSRQFGFKGNSERTISSSIVRGRAAYGMGEAEVERSNPYILNDNNINLTA